MSLMTVEETVAKIREGKILFLAGDESLLQKLPQGRWIGGTIHYFMTVEQGGVEENANTPTHLFVNELPEFVSFVKIANYTEANLSRIPADSHDHGFSLIIIPSESPAHFSYAQNAPNFRNIFFKNILGWIAGVHLSQLGTGVTAKVFNGDTGEVSDQNAVVMHLSLPPNRQAEVCILNLFQQGNGENITFDQAGFEIEDCFINGEKQNFARYLLDNKIDTRLPLVANYCGSMVNVSFQRIDEKKQRVHLYAPVFQNQTYKIAAPLPQNYVTEFRKKLRTQKNVQVPVFACNCILNYLYGELQTENTSPFVGPMTFGEIAYQLVNQTLVYIEITEND